MPQTNIKDAIAGLRDIPEDSKVPLIDLMRPWMAITGLEFKDVVHLTAQDLGTKLRAIHTKFGDSLDLFDEDQLREAACRCMQKVTVYGELIKDGDVAVRQSQDMIWDGTTWTFVVDPRMRLRQTSKSYVESLAAVKEQLSS
jgi:hypothetical protein